MLVSLKDSTVNYFKSHAVCSIITCACVTCMKMNLLFWSLSPILVLFVYVSLSFIIMIIIIFINIPSLYEFRDISFSVLSNFLFLLSVRIRIRLHHLFGFVNQMMLWFQQSSKAFLRYPVPANWWGSWMLLFDPFFSQHRFEVCCAAVVLHSSTTGQKYNNYNLINQVF